MDLLMSDEIGNRKNMLRPLTNEFLFKQIEIPSTLNATCLLVRKWKPTCELLQVYGGLEPNPRITNEMRMTCQVTISEEKYGQSI